MQPELGGQRHRILNGGLQYKMGPAALIGVHVETKAEGDLLGGASGRRRARRLRRAWGGWVGVGWQIIPRALARLKATGDERVAQRMMTAMMAMVKLDGSALNAAARGWGCEMRRISRVK